MPAFDNSKYDPNNALKRIYDQENLLDVLLEFEKALDSFDLYVFPNWISGEIVSGPWLERYWVKLILKYPYKDMPDPQGGQRLLQHGAKVAYQLVKEEVPIDLTTINPEDRMGYYDSTGKRKTKEEKVWLVHIKIPRRFIADIEVGTLETEKEDEESIDLTAAQDGEESGLDQETAIQDEEQIEGADEEDEEI